MLRHIVLLTFSSESTPEDRDAWRKAVREMCETSPEVLSFTLGDNVGKGPNHHDTAVVMDFADMAAFRSYIDGPAHQTYVAEHARKVAGKIAAIQHPL